MLDKAIGNEDAILWTQNTGTLQLKKKSGLKVVDFGFATDAFELTSGINDLYQKGTFLLSVFCCPVDLLSEGARAILSKESK